MNRKLRHLMPMAILACATLVAPAALASSADVIRDCASDEVLNGHYSQGELQGALKNLPSDLDEYTTCRSVIRHAELSNAGGNASKPKTTASQVDPNAPATRRELRKIAQASQSNSAVSVGGQVVKPGEAGFLAAAFNSRIPSLLIAVFVLFGVAALAGIAFAAERRFPQPVHATTGLVARPLQALGRGIRRGASRFRR